MDYAIESSLAGVCSWVFFFVVDMRVDSPAMMVSILLERLTIIVFGVISAASCDKRLSRWVVAV